MALGILKVAAVLEQAGIHVEMLDLSGTENYEEVVRDHVRSESVSCYGLTAPHGMYVAQCRCPGVIGNTKQGPI